MNFMWRVPFIDKQKNIRHFNESMVSIRFVWRLRITNVYFKGNTFGRAVSTPNAYTHTLSQISHKHIIYSVSVRGK